VRYVLNDDVRSARQRAAAPVWLVLLLVPFLASACISVQSDLLATPTPLPASSPGADASPTQAPLASPTPPPTPAPTPEPVEAEVLGFVPNWLLEDAADAIDSDLVTIAAFHSIEASQDGKLVSKKPNGDVPAGWAALQTDTFEKLRTDLQSDGVKVVPVIQRVGWTEGTSKRTVTLLSKQKNRRALAERIAAFVSDRGFDGANLDFEPIPAEVAAEYVELVREVRAALDKVDPGLHLSIDVIPGLQGYDLAALTADDAADLAVIMGYGYRTGASAVAGSTAPLVDAQSGDLTSTVAAALGQAAPADLALALPWYGLAWSTEDDKAGSAVRSGKGIDGPASANYSVAVAQAAESGRRYEADQAAAWTAYATKQCSGCPATWRQIWYDDPDSFRAKAESALGQGLAGIGIWALGMDQGREEMGWALRDLLRPRLDELPPNGSPALDPDAIRGELGGRSVVIGSAPLRLFAGDDVDGSGLAFTRVGLASELDDDGMLVTGRTYPPSERIDFPLGDESTGGSSAEGPRSIHVQWRDLAGNWSVPIVIEAHVLDPESSTTPSDL
jgi:spore germination protein YaaH